MAFLALFEAALGVDVLVGRRCELCLPILLNENIVGPFLATYGIAVLVLALRQALAGISVSVVGVSVRIRRLVILLEALLLGKCMQSFRLRRVRAVSHDLLVV